MKTIFLFLGIALFQFNLNAQQDILPADKVMSAALQSAAKQNKNVILIFHADRKSVV